jgi:hypothetical protein
VSHLPITTNELVGHAVAMKLGLGLGLGLVLTLTYAACTDDSVPDVDNAEALCRQWDKVDAEHAAETRTASEETTKLAAMLPAEYDDEAALAFYPAAGDPGPNASGAMAAEAGEELQHYRIQVCGDTVGSFAEFFVVADTGYAFERVDRVNPEPVASLSEGDDCFTDPGWVTNGAPFARGEHRLDLPVGAQTGEVNVMLQCAMLLRD